MRTHCECQAFRSQIVSELFREKGASTASRPSVTSKSHTSPVGLTYYELIGVSPAATTEEVESAYRRASKAYHPDLGGPGANSALFREATAARDILVDPRKRRQYDEMIQGGTTHDSSDDWQPESSQSGRTSHDYQRTNTRSATERQRMRRKYSLLGIAASFYVGGRWVTRVGIGLHFGLIEACGRQLVALSAILIVAFFIVSRKQLARLHLQVRKLLFYRFTIAGLKSHFQRTSASTQR